MPLSARLFRRFNGLAPMSRGFEGMLSTLSTSSCAFSTHQTLHQSRSRTQVWSEKKMVGYSCKQLFNVVSQVEHYHKFIPYCKKSVVTIRQSDSLSANLLIGFQPFFNISYTSHVTMIKPYLVTAVCKDMSLFQHLHTVWKFNPVQSGPDCCEVDFAVSFKFLNAGHSYVARLVLEEVVKKNMSAFISRTGQLYGPEAPLPPSATPERHAQKIYTDKSSY